MIWQDKKFKFMNTIYTIKFVDKIQRPDNDPIKDGVTFGNFNPDTKEITIATVDSKGKPYKPEDIKQTIRHELMHLILFEGMYLSCYEDEPLVEWLAKSIGILVNKKLL